MDDVKVGTEVRLPETHGRGRVVEIDRELLVARVALNSGGECWQKIDELEVVTEWEPRRRIAYIGAE